VWYHAVFTRTSAGACTSYLNAVYAGAQITGAGTNGVRLNIGVDTANYSSAIIDDVAIFNRVLSAEEVRSLYAGGQDLRFSSDIDGKTRLAHEIVSFDKGTSKAEVWVKANTLDFDDNTDIYVHYGNATASALDENEAFGKHQVWGESWEGVWHLNEASGTRIDATKNSYDLTDNNTVTSATGKIGTAADFEATNSESLSIADGSCPNLEILGSQTLLAWVKPESTTAGSQVFAKTNAGNTIYRKFGVGGSNEVVAYTTGVSDTVITTFGIATLSLATWTHIGFRFDGSNKNIYINGSSIIQEAVTGSFNDTNSTFTIGRDSDRNTEYFDGLIDDAMVYNGALSDDFITTLYNNQNSPSTFAIPSGLANASFLLNFV
jgi:hypothetical protein